MHSRLRGTHSALGEAIHESVMKANKLPECPRYPQATDSTCCSCSKPPSALNEVAAKEAELPRRAADLWTRMRGGRIYPNDCTSCAPAIPSRRRRRRCGERHGAHSMEFCFASSSVENQLSAPPRMCNSLAGARSRGGPRRPSDRSPLPSWDAITSRSSVRRPAHYDRSRPAIPPWRRGAVLQRIEKRSQTRMRFLV